MVELADRIADLDSDPEASMPLPGGGATSERHRRLLELGRKDLSLARIAEAHADATAILAEAGRRARPGSLYGVWASDGPQSRLTATLLTSGEWQLDGVKQYCSGTTFVTSALVTAHHQDALLLFDVPVDRPGIRMLPSTWATPALADTATGAVSFDRVALGPGHSLGTENWYLTRPGFWHGAIGPAACWAGGAISLIDSAFALHRGDPHSRAQTGALLAASWGIHAVLDRAGREIDADPLDERGDARNRALKVRHLIERWCTEVLDRFGRATGPRLLAEDGQVARQHMGLAVYIRQCHGERDLEAITG